MKCWLILFSLLIAASPCSGEDYSQISAEKLIGELVTLKQAMPGVDGGDTFEAFFADGRAPEFAGGLLPMDEPVIPKQARELVRRGVAALPMLLAHLDDARSTKINVGGDVAPVETVSGQFFNEEYDPRELGASDAIRWPDCFDDKIKCRAFDHPYIVKVGDICEVLIGQIVNRSLLAARYQPTAIVYVNSPIETPSLAKRIRADWTGLDAKSHEASLLSDLRHKSELSGWQEYRGALARLRFYYSNTYASLTGDDLKKREAFETEEKKDRVR